MLAGSTKGSGKGKKSGKIRVAFRERKVPDKAPKAGNIRTAQ